PRPRRGADGHTSSRAQGPRDRGPVVRLVVVGDIHVQPRKLWAMLRDAGLADERNKPTDELREGDVKLVLLGDLVHAKSRERYAELINVRRYDEYNPQIGRASCRARVE